MFLTRWDANGNLLYMADENFWAAASGLYERLDPAAYGNDPVNWAASLEAGGTPGLPNSGVLVPKAAGWKFQDKGVDLDTPFNLAAPAAARRLRVDADYDDGFILPVQRASGWVCSGSSRAARF